MLTPRQGILEESERLHAVPAPAGASMVEAAPLLPPRAPGKQGRAEGGMKAPPARAAKKARQDAFDPMDPVSTLLLASGLS